MAESLEEMKERRDSCLNDAASIITGLTYIAEFIQDADCEGGITERCKTALVWMLRPCLKAAQVNIWDGSDLVWQIDKQGAGGKGRP